MPLGIYISVPFCRSKCSYCNFASDVFSRERMQGYVERLRADLASSSRVAAQREAELPREVDSIYLGGGTPTVLAPEQMQGIFKAIHEQFVVHPGAEITVECAPGTLSEGMIATLVASGVNRVSLGVQSFLDAEAKSVARLHTRETTLRDIERLRASGITNINVDLIAGLPHQTAESWDESLGVAVGTGVPHVSVYMLEVDEDSRLGRELLAGGVKYHAHHVPDDDLITRLYERACERLDRAGIPRYEISNFARPGYSSCHNLKYWTRQPYIGFGLDAHSMLYTSDGAVRFSTTDNLDSYSLAPLHSVTQVGAEQALEEEFFLGLRLNRGVNLAALRARYGEPVQPFMDEVEQLTRDGLLSRDGERIFLTPRGRLLSNEVFQHFIREPARLS